jgi:hypothetical protein
MDGWMKGRKEGRKKAGRASKGVKGIHPTTNSKTARLPEATFQYTYHREPKETARWRREEERRGEEKSRERKSKTMERMDNNLYTTSGSTAISFFFLSTLL